MTEKLPLLVLYAALVFNWNDWKAGAVRSALHSPANMYLLLVEFRLEFLRKSAGRLQRSGWLLLQTGQPLAMGLLPDFDAVYNRTQSFETAGYLAVHYAARQP